MRRGSSRSWAARSISRRAAVASARQTAPKEASTHFLLLAKNETGYHNLLKLVSAAHLEGQYYKPRIDKEILAQHSEGLIGTSACLAGEVARHIMAGRAKDAAQSIDTFKSIFAPGDFYLEIADHGIPQQKQVAAELFKYAKQFGLENRCDERRALRAQGPRRRA